MTRAEILAEASRIITKDRNDQYGEPEHLFEAVAMIWRGMDMARGDRPRGPGDVGLYLAGLKLARASANPTHVDSFIDGAGYFACSGGITAGCVE